MSEVIDFFERELHSLLEDTQQAVFQSGKELQRASRSEVQKVYDNGSAIAQTIEIYNLPRSENLPPVSYVRVHAPLKTTGDYLERLTAGTQMGLPRIRTRADWIAVRPRLRQPRLIKIEGRKVVFVQRGGKQVGVYAEPDEVDFQSRFYQLAEQIANEIELPTSI